MSRITKIELQQQVSAKVEIILALQREISELRQQVSDLKHAAKATNAAPANAAKATNAAPAPTPAKPEQHVLFTALDRSYAFKAYEQLKRKGQRAHYEPFNVKRNGRVATVYNVITHGG
jgi:hypothetical protein